MSGMKIVDMRPSGDDKKDGEISSTYGMRVSLGGDQLDKLGMKALPKPGDEHDIGGKVKILSVSVPPDGEENSSPRVEMHITHFGVGDPKETSLRDQIKGAADNGGKK